MKIAFVIRFDVYNWSAIRPRHVKFCSSLDYECRYKIGTKCLQVSSYVYGNDANIWGSVQQIELYRIYTHVTSFVQRKKGTVTVTLIM